MPELNERKGQDVVMHAMTYREILARAVRGARDRTAPKHFKHPRWVAVADLFALGSGYSHDLCREFGLDPDEEVKRG